MNVGELLSNIEEIKPNILDEAILCRHISDLDTKINRQVFEKSEKIEYSPDEGDKVLLVGTPYERMYEYYLLAMIDYFNSEINSYNINMSLFNKEYEEFIREYRRGHIPSNSGGFFGFFG